MAFDHTTTCEMRVEMVMNLWRPGSQDPPWGWQDEIKDLRDRGELHALSHELMRGGNIREPVLLGGDGRVWDGHHRIIACYMQGKLVIPVTFGFVSEVPASLSA